MKYTYYTLFYSCVFILLSCTNNQNINDIELKILNNKLLTYNENSKKDTINIISFEISNNSNNIYYLNSIINSNKLFTSSIYKNGITLKIFDKSTNNEVYYIDKFLSDANKDHKPYADSIFVAKNFKRLHLELERLNSVNNFRYYATKENRYNFFIHPKEKLYFEMYLTLKDTLSYEYDRVRYVSLDKSKNYFARLFFASDSTTAKEELPRHILKTIEANNAKVYHGVIESKNIVPVKVLE
jgi:hypothetical protein